MSMRPDNLQLIGNITAQQERFCQHYTAIGSETFCNATNSMQATQPKCKCPDVKGSRWTHYPAIKARITALLAEKMERDNITVGKVLADIEHDKQLARAKGDMASALRADELHGKYLAMFAERQIIDVQDSRRLDTEHAAQNKRIADFMISHGLLESGDTRLIPASFEPVSGVQDVVAGSASVGDNSAPIADNNHNNSNNTGLQQ